MPGFLARRWANSERVRVQVLTSDGDCFDTIFGTIKKNSPLLFKAKAP
jgi:hypothetical protein